MKKSSLTRNTKMLFLVFFIFHYWGTNINAQTTKTNDCSTCSFTNPSSGPDYHGQNLTDYNFTTLGASALRNANFQGATLKGAQFQNMDLTNANFSNANLSPSTKGKTDFSGAIMDQTCFINAVLDSANFQYAQIKAANFSCASMYYTDFGPTMTIAASSADATKRTKFNFTTLDFSHFPIKNWPTNYWALTNLSYVAISGMTSKNFSFKSRNITNAILQGNNYYGFDFSHAVMVGVDLTAANVSYAKMDTVLLTSAILADIDAQNVSMVGGMLCDTVNVRNGANLSGANFNKAIFTRANLKATTLSGATFISATMASAKFDNANMEAITTGKTYSPTNFQGSTLNYTSFTGARVNGVIFTSCFLDKANFNNLTLDATNFSGANMPETNFSNAKLQGTQFSNAILQSANFKNATMSTSASGGTQVNFSCSQLGGTDFTNATVTSASFYNAVMLMADSCCSTVSGPYCGKITYNNVAYGATIFPILNDKVTCPNGDIAMCNGVQWSIPNWAKNTCISSNAKMWYKPNCNGQDTTGTITFTDLNLKNCIINQYFGGDQSQIITKNWAAQITSLNCPQSNISSLGGLESFKALQQLDVSANHLTDGTFFKKLPALQQLKISYNQYPSLDFTGIYSLNNLQASNNNIGSIAFDANIYLSYLDVSHNVLSSLILTYQTSLNYGDLSFNQLTTIGNISNLKLLNSLYVENNRLTSIGDLSTLVSCSSLLSILNLACNSNFDCSTLNLPAPGVSTSVNKCQTNFKNHINCGQNSIGCN
jgi:uncharacterized protein YjbI with pentapeptide repeats